MQDATWCNLASFRGGDAIEPGSDRLVSPILRLGMSRVGPSGDGLSKQLRQVLADFGTKSRVNVSLETIVFSDGSVIGPDRTNAAAQARAYLDAERQIANLISGTQASGGDVAQALNGLANPQDSKIYLSFPPTYEESLANKTRQLASLLLHSVQTRPDAVDGLLGFKKNVDGKRHMRIAVK